MKHQFLLHELSHTILVVEITEIGFSNQAGQQAGQQQSSTPVRPQIGRRQMVPAVRFQSWKDAEDYFLGLEADTETLKKTLTHLQKTSVAVLTIV